MKIKEIRRIFTETFCGIKILRSVVCEIDDKHRVVSAQQWKEFFADPDNVLYNFEHPDGIKMSRLYNI